MIRLNLLPMKLIITKPLGAIVATFLLLFLNLIVFAQANPAEKSDTTGIQSIVTIVGWISLSFSALASAAAVVYGVVKRKDWEQIKEARDNYKSLAESYKEKANELEHENNELKAENEKLTHKVLRQ